MRSTQTNKFIGLLNNNLINLLVTEQITPINILFYGFYWQALTLARHLAFARGKLHRYSPCTENGVMSAKEWRQ